MGIFQINSNQNVFWIMLTIFIVLGPDRASSWQKALKRSGGVIVGALVISGLSEVLPAEVIFGLAAVRAAWRRALSSSATTPSGRLASHSWCSPCSARKMHDFIIWAERRVVDTLIGAAIALLVGYLVLPDRKQKS